MAASFFAYGVKQRLLTYASFSTIGVIYVGWDYSRRGPSYNLINSTYSKLQSRGLIDRFSKPPSPERLRELLELYTVKRVPCLTGYNDTQEIISSVLSNFSHQAPMHLLFNTIAWSSFGYFFYWLPARHYAMLIAGSAASSTLLFDYNHRYSRTPATGLGASGIVSGLAMAVTCLAPTTRAGIIFVPVRVPLWMLMSAFFMVDYYGMQQERSSSGTGIGHSAHIGGALFGAAYYGLFLRRYGGILGPRY